MTENYSYRVPSTYQVWKEYKRTVYKTLRNFGVPSYLMDDYYQESYFIFDALLAAYNPKKSKLHTWLNSFFPQKLGNLYWKTKSLIGYPLYKQKTKGEGLPRVISLEAIEKNNGDEDKTFIISKDEHDYYNDIDNKYDTSVIRRILEYAMKRIPPEYAILIKEYYGIDTQRKNLRELSEIHGGTIENVRGKIMRGKSKIEKILRNRYDKEYIGELLDYEA